jgi:hypothetical protein
MWPITASQSHPVSAGQPREPLDRRMQQLGVGREGDGLGLHGRVDRDPLEVFGAISANDPVPPSTLARARLATNYLNIRQRGRPRGTLFCKAHVAKMKKGCLLPYDFDERFEFLALGPIFDQPL